MLPVDLNSLNKYETLEIIFGLQQRRYFKSFGLHFFKLIERSKNILMHIKNVFQFDIKKAEFPKKT